MDWQPIETAPRDGTDILIYVQLSNECFVAYWHSRFSKLVRGDAWAFATLFGGRTAYTKEATHWMPLPEPPKAAE